MIANLNAQSKAIVAAVFAGGATALEANADVLVDDISAWVSGTLLAAIAWGVTWLKANGTTD